MFHLLYSSHHRVGRVLSFFPVVGIGTPPTPHPQASVPLPLVPGGGAHSLAREGWESPNSGKGTDTVVLCMYKYFVLHTMYVLRIKSWIFKMIIREVWQGVDSRIISDYQKQC
jgi:hypothetical protein